MCVQEERLKHEIPESAYYVNCAKENTRKDKGISWKKKADVQMKRDSNKDKYHFCKKKRHFKKDCAMYKKWLEKKDNLTFVCYESCYIEAPDNTTW